MNIGKSVKIMLKNRREILGKRRLESANTAKNCDKSDGGIRF